MENLHQHIEAIIFSSDSAVTAQDIQQVLVKAFPELILDGVVLQQMLNDLEEKFKSDIFSFELRVIGGGYQFFSKPQYYTTVATLIGQREKKRLSTAALETLSIIAYRGPVTKGECEKVRGVNCDYSVEKLLEKELIEVAGRMDEMPGKPVLYRVTQNFLDYFGINSTADLPKLKDVLMPTDENVVGEQPEVVSDMSPEEENEGSLASENKETPAQETE
jgi:segregation and condensation protein B